jgi:hypothetical protein
MYYLTNLICNLCLTKLLHVHTHYQKTQLAFHLSNGSILFVFKEEKRPHFASLETLFFVALKILPCSAEQVTSVRVSFLVGLSLMTPQIFSSVGNLCKENTIVPDSAQGG